ncbi:putative leucine-rich repeat receptor-like serine/threonine-protein kinase [Heracleum sosnowskyi]|uniref:Leucine-rich repeat receptor-like serine/threonine-protein kinase n=1 Tax=Heracleum sosnowskyi TaxID=360622 RepID=A0AAD8HMV2_9APIA|nr:putative leucine-rich repeat receptor-like serine/threonine-protein kinase [Heracleum sosnowskyi]
MGKIGTNIPKRHFPHLPPNVENPSCMPSLLTCKFPTKLVKLSLKHQQYKWFKYRQVSSSEIIEYCVPSYPTMQSISFIIFNTMIPTVILSLILVSAEAKTLQLEIDALRAFTLSIDPTSITQYSFLNTWDFDLDPCESTGSDFLGILCTMPHDNSSSQITTIDLEGDGYEGFLTPAIVNLTALTTLNLKRNQFRGPIPPAISTLGNLTGLLLSGNYFSGNMPDVGKLKKLVNLDLSNNLLSGPIPASISGLRRLTHMTMSNNDLVGMIPDLSGLWQLNTLDLSTNQLMGSFPSLPQNLRTLSLAHNLLSGRISPIQRIESLERVDFSDNRLSGNIDPEILTLPFLNYLNLSANRFTSVEVNKFADDSSQLQVVDMHENRLQGNLPINLFTYSNLTSLNLGHNVFSGRIPEVYGDMLGKPWQSLFLDYNFLEGNLPSEFTNTANLNIRGSLARNCLNCPRRLEICRGGQRRASECAKQ